MFRDILYKYDPDARLMLVSNKSHNQNESDSFDILAYAPT